MLAAKDIAHWHIVDLTQTVGENVPRMIFQRPLHFETLVDYPQGALVRGFTLDEHQGTHVDAPSHFVPGGKTLDQIPPSKLVTHAYILDVRNYVDLQHNYGVQIKDILDFESQAGAKIEDGLVIAWTGWAKFWRNPEAYFGGKGGENGYPGWTLDAAQFLLTERGVSGLGIDGPSVDGSSQTDYPVHKFTLGYGCICVENLVNLEEVTSNTVGIVIAPLKLEAGSGAPARVFALL